MKIKANFKNFDKQSEIYGKKVIALTRNKVTKAGFISHPDPSASP